MASSDGPPTKRLKVDDTPSYLIESPNLVTQEDWEKEEDRVRLDVMRRIVKRKRDVIDNVLTPEQLKERLHADSARSHNRECVRGWRDRYGLQRTIHHLDRMRKMNQANATLSKKLRQVVQDVEKSKKRLEEDVKRNAKNPTANREKLVRIRNWLKKVPEVLNKAKMIESSTKNGPESFKIITTTR